MINNDGRQLYFFIFNLLITLSIIGMKFKDNLLQYGLLGILISDILGSLTSRVFDFNYSYLAPLSALIYCSIGFLATKEKNLKTGVSYTAKMGLFDSTIGWIVAILLKANTGDVDLQPYSFTIYIAALIILVIFTSMLGLVGGVVALLFKKANQTPVNHEVF